MSSVQNPILIQTRTHKHGSTKRTKVRKPDQPPFDKKVMMAVSEPFTRRDRRPSWEKCRLPEFVEQKKQAAETVHPWEVIKVRFQHQLFMFRFNYFF